MSNRFVLSEFLRDREWIACLVLAEDLFSLLSREILVPPGCAALVWGEAGPPEAVGPGRGINASATRQVLLVRTEPCGLEYAFPNLHSSDGYTVSADLRFTAQPAADRAELLAFHQAVAASAGDVRRDRLHEHCQAAARTACAEVVRRHPAQMLLTPTSMERLASDIIAQLQPLAFSSGLLLGGEVRLSLVSDDYTEALRIRQEEERRQQRQLADQQLRAAAAAARRQHLAELSSLLEEVRRIHDAHPELSMADIIRSFAPAHRPALQQALLAQGESRSEPETLAIVAGEEVLWFDLAEPEQPRRRVNLSSAAGPLRSIRVGRLGDQSVLLVGARRGVHVIRPDGERLALGLLPDGTEPAGGVNSAALLGDRLYATHSEVGLARWEVVRTGGDAVELRNAALCLPDLVRRAAAVRAIQADGGGRLWFCVDSRVIGWRPSEDSPPIQWTASAEITALVRGDDRFFAGTTSGVIHEWSSSSGNAGPKTIRAGGGQRVHGLDWLASDAVPRLLIAEDRFGLNLLLVAEDAEITYRADQRIRWGRGASASIVGVNDRRDHFIIWSLDITEKPRAAVSIGRICGRSIQDLAIIPPLASAPPSEAG